MDEATREEVTRLLKRGLNHYGLGDLEAAIRSWEEARELDPENRAAHDYLETAYEESGRAGKEQDGSQGHDSLNVPFDDDATPRTFDGPPQHPKGASLPGVPTDADRPDTVVAVALEAYKAGKLDDAWEALQEAAAREPERLDVQGYLVMVRSERARQWAREVGDQGRALRLPRSMGELMQEMNLRPEEGFLLSQIDGELSVEQLLNLSNDRVKTLELIAKLLKEGVIE